MSGHTHTYIHTHTHIHTHTTTTITLAHRGLISQGLPHQLRTLHLLSNGIYIYSSVQYIYTAALFYHDCTEFKKNFILYFRLVSC